MHGSQKCRGELMQLTVDDWASDIGRQKGAELCVGEFSVLLNEKLGKKANKIPNFHRD